MLDFYYTWRQCDTGFQFVTHGGSMLQNFQSGLLYLLACSVYRLFKGMYTCIIKQGMQINNFTR